MIQPKLGDWDALFKEWGITDMFEYMLPELELLIENTNVFPGKSKIFRAFKECQPNNMKVVMLAQDPYHNLYGAQASACGLCFATENGYVNPSLRNILVEINDDIGINGWIAPPKSVKLMGNNNPDHLVQRRLLEYPQQGVLMLNAALTVERAKPGEHLKFWSAFTEKLITKISRTYPHVVWILLGAKAQEYQKYIIDGRIVKAPHPAAEVYAGGKAGFFGSKIFSKTNEILKEQGKDEIKW